MKSPTTIKQPGIHLLVFSHNLCYCTTKILLFPRLIHNPSNNYQSKSDDNPECPSAKLQLHLLPAGEVFFHWIRHLYLLGDRHFFGRQIYRIWLRPHLCKQVTKAVNSQLGLSVPAVGYIQPRQEYSAVFVTLQQRPNGGAVRRQLYLYQLLYDYAIRTTLDRYILHAPA